MKRMQIFKAGRQTSGSGEALDFTEDQLRKTVEAYDPKLHEAPIVVGHPKDNAPAYGWISGLDFKDGLLHADTDQLHPEFEEMVKSGAFKKRSASFYKPDSPANPVPGTFYLRHVGFLGAQPPAVKGLADPEFKEGKIPDAVEFSDSADDVVEFSDARTVSTILRRMREFFIDRFGSEDADKVLPAFLIEDLEDEARRESESTTDPAFSEDDPTKPTGGNPMPLSDQEIKDLQAKAAKADDLEKENGDLKKQASDFAEREKKLARAEIEKSVDALIDEGRVLPAKRASMIDYLESLDNATELEFSEGEGDKKSTKKMSQRAYFLEELSQRPPVVDFEERSKENGENGDDSADYQEVADEAIAYQERELQAGRKITASQAVKAVKSGKHKQ